MADEQKNEDDRGEGAPAPRPFDSSLFDQEDAGKPTSPSFPAESPFMSFPSDNPSSKMESSTNMLEGNVQDKVQEANAESATVPDKVKPVANYFAGDEGMMQGSGSFFDSFSSAKGDENNLFSTPPTSIGATPVTPEGPGFNVVEETQEDQPDTRGSSLDPGAINSETVSIDSTNLLADDERKLGSASNLETMSMDSTNLLSEESYDQNVDQANESFDSKQEGKGDSTQDDIEDVETGSEALETTIDLGSPPETETNVSTDDATKSSSETIKKEETQKPLSLANPVSSVDGGGKQTLLSLSTKAVPTPSKSEASPSPPIASLPVPPTSSSTHELSAAQSGGSPSPPVACFSPPSGPVNPDVMARPRAPFESSPSQDGDDPFVQALRSSEIDRRHDAWLPSEATQKILANRSVALQGSEFVVRDQLTMPGVIAEEPQGDPLRDLVQRYMGEQEASRRNVLTVNKVTRDEAGLKKLLGAGCIRAAIDLTGLLLTSGGQGKGQCGLPSRHSPHLMQVWFTRISLFLKLQQFTAAEQELEAFGNMDKPDLFFEYYPDLYPGRKGSIVPFTFRIIHAELPMYTGKHQLCLDRLAALLTVCHMIIQHLEDGRTEYGQVVELSQDNRKASLDLWKSREIRVLHSVGNCLVAMKEYMQAVNVFKSLIEKEPEQEVGFLGGIARVYLQLGDLKSAQEIYTTLEKKLSSQDDNVSQARIHLNRGFLKVAQNQYADAYKHFAEALKIEPANFMAINNLSVCCLYIGKLKEALSLLEKLVNRETGQFLDESLIFNLCTLYELESSRSIAKKQQLLGLVCRFRGDGFNTSCLKMP